MFSKIPQNLAASDDNDSQSTDVQRDTDEVISIHCEQNTDTRQLLIETTENTPGKDLVVDIAQMAYLQLMTQKVMEVVANNPDAIKLMNSAIRDDED